MSAFTQSGVDSDPNAPLVQLGAGDVLNVQFYGLPDLETTTYIADDGTITMPLAGAVHVAGRSPSAAAQEIANAFRQGQLLLNPQVSVLVTQSRSQQVSVLGEVRNPGRFVIDSTTSLLDLLAQAGGTNERSGDTVFVIRPDGAGNLERHAVQLMGLQDGQVALNFPALRGGDAVFVPPADQFYIYGEVQSPNMYRLEPGMTVLQAISRSGGLTDVASRRRVRVKRRAADGTVVTTKVDPGERVQPNDVIYVKDSLF
jgi:polysaccharide export outer membrane protein